MASVKKSGRGWTGKYIGINGQRIEKRVPKARWDAGRTDSEQRMLALAHVQEVEALCLRACTNTATPGDIVRLVEFGVISHVMVDDAGISHVMVDPKEPKEAKEDPRRVTITQLAKDNPVAQGMEVDNEGGHQQFMGWLDDFITWLGHDRACDVTFKDVKRYIQYLDSEQNPHGKPYARDSIDKRTRPIRWANKMAPLYGVRPWMPEKARLITKRRTSSPRLSLEELIAAMHYFRDLDDPRAFVVTGLGGFMGLDNKEIRNITIGDIDWINELVHCGSKNAHRRRILPILPALLPAMKRLAEECDDNEPLLETLTSAGYRRHSWTSYALVQWFHRRIREAIGKPFPVGKLRHSFATWVTHYDDGKGLISARHREHFLGHAVREEGGSAVSEAHYIGEATAFQLRSSAELINQVLVDGMNQIGNGELFVVADDVENVA